MRILRFVPVAFLAAACAGPAPADLIPVPTAAPLPLFGPMACPSGLLEGELVADDEFGFVVTHANGSSAVAWPNGYVGRDAARRELLDDSGRVVAREGDRVALGGGYAGAGPTFVVCGQFEVTPVP